MLLHLRPRCLSRYRDVELVDFAIPELGLHLVGGKDLTTRRPYPNKRYAVACRHQGRKAIDGLLIDVNRRIERFSTIARWAINADFIAKHQVAYQVLDCDYDLVTDSVVLWYPTSGVLGSWDKRIPSWVGNAAPVEIEPRMEVDVPEKRSPYVVADEVDSTRGRIRRRSQTFRVPTVERERLQQCRFNDRLPDIASAFRVA
jgi:Family of unknown function (DUF6012)